MDTNSLTHDTIIIGAGPAGLTAAIYLGRFRRRCLVLEDGRSRAHWIPTSHNIPGFASGVGGEQFLKALKAQALKYGAQFQSAHVTTLTATSDFFVLDTDRGTFQSRFVVLATGVADHLPAIEGASEAVMRSLLRFCPICDGFEAIDAHIAVIGDGPLAERETQFLKTYSERVSLLMIESTDLAPDWDAADATTERLIVRLSDIRVEENAVVVDTLTGERRFDVVYSALGCSPRHELARALGARCDEHCAMVVNAHQETSVPGIYAAGDVVRGLNQVVVAAAESAIAATDIHNKLRLQ
jgi:thioredoxin reductase (NADPH)